MAKDFSKMAGTNVFADVARKSNSSARLITIKMVNDEDLVDFPDNREDITQTIDLETSMQENGFTDPIEVTNYGMDNENKYMILSGHRRRVAGRKVGIGTFPCIIKSFKDSISVQNYVLLANSQRDSDNDPLLRAKRYKMHEEYLIKSSFKGSKRDEIAKRMNMSAQQADRYKAFCRVISPVWDMVQTGTVGMSSIVSMSTFAEREQGEILDMLNECLSAGDELTRATCKLIIIGYKEGKKSYAEITHGEEPPDIRESKIPLNAFMSSEPGETRSTPGSDGSNEMHHEIDEIAREADRADADQAEWEHQQVGKDSPDQMDKTKTSDKQDNYSQNGKKISILIQKVTNAFNEIYEFEDEEEAEQTVYSMIKMIKTAIDEIYEITQNHKKNNILKELVSELEKKIIEYQ